MKIFTTKTKIMAGRGKEPIRTEILINDEMVEQMSHFNYMGNGIDSVSYTHLDVYKRQTVDRTCSIFSAE